MNKTKLTTKCNECIDTLSAIGIGNIVIYTFSVLTLLYFLSDYIYQRNICVDNHSEYYTLRGTLMCVASDGSVYVPHHLFLGNE